MQTLLYFLFLKKSLNFFHEQWLIGDKWNQGRNPECCALYLYQMASQEVQIATSIFVESHDQFSISCHFQTIKDK